jgi:hypothetical protein
MQHHIEPGPDSDPVEPLNSGESGVRIELRRHGSSGALKVNPANHRARGGVKRASARRRRSAVDSRTLVARHRGLRPRGSAPRQCAGRNRDRALAIPRWRRGGTAGVEEDGGLVQSLAKPCDASGLHANRRPQMFCPRNAYGTIKVTFEGYGPANVNSQHAEPPSAGLVYSGAGPARRSPRLSV